MKDHAREERYAQYLNDLYTTAHIQYGDCPEIDALVQDSIVAFFLQEEKGTAIAHPRAMLSGILRHKYNDWLRRKYRNRLVSYEYDLPEDIEAEPEIEAHGEEYEQVRREIGRLMRIYREVTVRYYVRGQSVDEIAADMDIPRGTVLSRLSKARDQIKEGLTNMEKYSSVSYEPKNLSLGIWGYCAPYSGEPFSLISSLVEANALILAYDHPLSVRGIADAMGMPCAYLEPIVDKLVDGELMGRTASGLCYTRCHLQQIENRYGNIPAQEALASERAAQVAETVNRHTAELFALPAVKEMTGKQKATLWLIVLNEALTIAIQQTRPQSPDIPKEPPERPNGGRWYASGTVMAVDPKERPAGHNTYARSGPVLVNYCEQNDGKADCRMKDFQSVFGDAHWAYQEKFPYKFSLQSILRFYASFLPCDITVDRQELFESIPIFEEMHILCRREDGKIRLDIPALTFSDAKRYLDPAIIAIYHDLLPLLGDELSRLWEAGKHRVPAHVDAASYYAYENALGAYSIAQMLAIVHGGLCPYPVTVGETPLILVLYRPCNIPPHADDEIF